MPIYLRGKTSGRDAEVDSLSGALVTRAAPFTSSTGGTYSLTSKSGAMSAGLAGNSPIYAFRNVSASLLVLLRRVKISAWSLGTGFTAGLGTFDLFRATSWTIADTGGTTDTITTVNGKMRTAMPSIAALAEIRHSSTAALAAGTRTLDTQTLESLNVNVPATTNFAFVPSPTFLFDRPADYYPLVLAQNEGVVIQATVPATGTWTFAITPIWDETPSFAP